MISTTSLKTSRTRLARAAAAVAAIALVVSLSACSSATAPKESPSDDAEAPITITLVRHAESEGNVGGPPDTGVPGPVITDKGEKQAEALVAEFEDRDFDALYVSTMVRTQQTAEPLAEEKGLDAVILPGVQESSLGIYDGKPYEETKDIVGPVVDAWFNGNPEPGLEGGDSGESIRDRVLGALAHVYESGAKKPVIFAHGCSIGCALMLFAKNAKDVPEDARILDNTAWVELKGSPAEGWTITKWAGRPLDG